MWKYESEWRFNRHTHYDFPSLLASNSESRDFLLRNDGTKVKLSSLNERKFVGLLFSASCNFYENIYMLVQLYKQKQGEFELVYVSSDENQDSFNAIFSKMTWLAIPFSDSTIWIRSRLNEFFHIYWPNTLVIFHDNGKFVTDEGVKLLEDYGLEAYPFTDERIDSLHEYIFQYHLSYYLVSESRDYFISNDGHQVPFSELEGKIVGLYLCDISNRQCLETTIDVLKDFYGKLKEKGVDDFEIVFIPTNIDDDDQEGFTKAFQNMPWLALPFTDKTCNQKILAYYQYPFSPVLLVIFGVDGKIMDEVYADVERLGIQAYPFARENLNRQIENSISEESQDFESLLASFDNEFVIRNDRNNE
ncbi:probable nucleoredoxin 1-2 [Humulus lupulus]|uniref:probable nucleoredoxin 1-2 n=1 Tax=Humulus lupulus TaxID=3486 RepID=UPI002B417F6C|nr:probable nucleoredoxin 1-2 [Humulus lupulus]